MNAFITGSYAYGTPRPDSDLDLVILADAQLIQILCDHDEGNAEGSNGTIRFGKLNVITLGQRKFEAWREATEYLKTIRPVTREVAVETIESYVEKAIR